MKRILHIVVLLCCLQMVSGHLHAQGGIIRGIGERIGSLGSGGGGGGSDSLRNRSKEEDSITTKIYLLDSSRTYKLDSSITDFTVRYPIPAHHTFIGNTGSATRSLLFTPRTRAGFDPGFHAFDAYKLNLEDIRFFNTTRPYTSLGYIIGGRQEQIIDVVHTQNIKAYWNFSFQYRLINAPGFFRNQKTNHNNYLFTSWYQSPNKRYNNYFIIVSNRIQSGENGGILKDQNYLDNPIYAQDPLSVPTNLGGTPDVSGDFFNTNISTGNKYVETNYILRQQYDFGRKDSIVTDTTVIPLFYPRVRFEHTLNYGKYQYTYLDLSSAGSRSNNTPDSAWYDSTYKIKFPKGTGGVYIQDSWKEVTNDFSIYQFPDANNLQQFIKLGGTFQLLSGKVSSQQSLFNFMGHAEYRNRTKNQKWDIAAFGHLYFVGYNASDYHASVNLQRLNSRIGNFQLGFENINRKPSYIFDSASNFFLAAPRVFSKENIVHVSGSYFQPRFKVQLKGDYYLLTNYLYFKEFYKPEQESSPFNVLRISASKTFTFFKRVRWYADVFLQQATGNVEVNLPLLYTRNRIGYEGKLGLKSLNIFFGTEIRYHTPYKADNYSPVLGQFFYQNSTTINNLPQIDAFMHLRIRGFRAFLRFDNLSTNAFGYNFAAPDYPLPGLITRLGIHWSFVN